MPLRLIDVATCQFANAAQLWEEENLALQEGGKLKYGILSHRWLREEDEVKYNDLSRQDLARGKKGYFKITHTCELARRDSLRYVWLDTCCIDKSSSAELQESINSMYRWYEDAAVCYVHLKDTDLDQTPASSVDIGRDEWFERAWTLQELVAPKNVKFYDKNCLLENKPDLEDFSIAERMSWAAGRKGTVVEDRAYSLFGLFGVNLPVLYGERENPFLRLQEEIIKTSDDHSIFAWIGIGDRHGGLLARAPEDFAASSLPSSTAIEGNVSGIFLQRLGEDGQYARVSVDGEEVKNNVRTPLSWERPGRDASRDVLVYVRQPKATARELTIAQTLGYRICSTLLRLGSKGEPLFGVHGPKGVVWDAATRLVTIPNGSATQGWIASINVWRQSNTISQIKLCFDFDFNPVVFLAATGAVGGKNLSDKNEAYRDKVEALTKKMNILLNRVGTLSTAVETLPGRATASGNVEWQYAPEEVNGSKSLESRTADDELGWSPISWDPRKGRVASQCPYRQGLWALKGDRFDGLDVFLQFDDKSLPNTRVKLQKVKTDYGLVWDLKTDNFPR
ncbi:hypothetical protein PG997_009251 [Apiospora hydei]|uniref:Heterokaryon incompatibility domain-containing protein n=1 Tax=Apiospora hydei TaxID=1337664 RepID=A0ABR1VTN5_9PEZI